MKKISLSTNSSSYILKKFSIYFLIFSILPLIFLFYLYFQYEETSKIIAISKENLRWVMSLVSLGIILSFIVIRRMLNKISLLSENLKKNMLDKIDNAAILDFAKDNGEVGDLAKVFGDILGKLQKNIDDLQETKKTLHDVLSKVGKALVSFENFDSLIQLILETTTDALEAKKGIIISVDENKELRLRAKIGLEGLPEKHILSSIGSYLNFSINEKKPIVTPSFEKNYDKDNPFNPPLLCMPLLFREKAWGAIFLSGRKKVDNFSEDEVKIVSNLSSQIGISFENEKLNENIEKTYFETMTALALAVEAKDHYSRGHSERVGLYAVRIGEELGLPKKDIETLGYASKLHDVGKIGIADNILKKASSLTEEEKKVMDRHPIVGESIIKPLKNFQHLLEPIRHHHEFLDGSGYPDRLKENEISFIARVLTVADIFEALTSERPYRKASSRSEAKLILQDLAKDGKIDKQIVNALFRLVDENRL